MASLVPLRADNDSGVVLEQGGVIVHEVHKGGVAEKDGRIQPGDFIVSVDGLAFKDITNKDAIRALRIAKDKVCKQDDCSDQVA